MSSIIPKWLWAIISNKVILRYAVVGVIGTLMHVGLVVIFVEFFHIPPTVSTAGAFFFVLITSYLLNRFWTFEKTSGKHWVDFIKYSMVSFAGLALNVSIMYTTVNVFEVWYAYGLVMVTLTVPVSNFLLNKYWVFKT
ncbi:MAG: GtrA family protein [Psychrosphaera sp.]|nr:GtrA family protein [Psychrosphaera sp.]